uniref:Retrotransposon Copia-like N-terminal domain-containing protein n=1 Tax=Manihot esculenta TaxID=3983 RepID=A0A2C9V077_MANES
MTTETKSDSSSPRTPAVLNTGHTSIILQNNQIITFNPSSQLPIKLSDSTNFPTWEAQIFTLLCGYDLLHFVDDNLIRNALMASVEHIIAHSIANAHTSKQVWDHLHIIYANKSQTRIFTFRDLLAKMQKDTKTVEEYLRDIRNLANELAAAGSPIDSTELILKILSGLGLDYKEISVAIRARDTPISFEELHDKLTYHELFLKHENAKKPQPTIIMQVAQSTAMSQTNQRP